MQDTPCYKCGSQESRVESDKVFRLGVPHLASLVQREVKYACSVCKEIRQVSNRLIDSGNYRPPIPLRSHASNDVVEQKLVSVGQVFSDKRLIALDYPAVFRVGDDVLFPTFEGNIQDATVIDRYGKPDLMVDFAEEYLRQFWILMPTGRLPNSLIEIMPALLLLFTATELAVKAYLIRSEKRVKPNHSLVDLYKGIDSDHREEIQRRFAESYLNSALSPLDIDSPKMEEILRLYSQTYGGKSNVHMDSRYYAEPTTKAFNNANLAKGNTPYPIFLPDAVRTLIDTYRFYSGSERLRRLGADLQGNFRDSGTDNHGEWGLIPSSLGLVVVVVSQKAGKDSRYEDLKVFSEFKKSYPTGFSADWMYGGNTLLFYRDNGQRFSDGKRVISGLECRVWSNGRLGLHSRDLYLLADALDCADRNADRFGYFTKTGVDGKRIT
ncbi:MAG: hypothetical protein OYM47_04050 [Gemmatimonadota bacterium]|nr:hypothetical protein [Gemmatimonadota bacterium]